MSWALRLWQSTIGKKVVMALTGFALFGFVIIHMLGNLQVYLPGKPKVDAAGNAVLDKNGRQVLEYPIDAYGHMLKSNKAVLWSARSVLLLCVFLHFVTAFQLWQRNRAARPEPYSTRNWREASLPARLMYLTGPMILFFIIYHLLHFTTGHCLTGFQDGAVRQNFLNGFSATAVGFTAMAIYVVANILLGMHLAHGGWSMFQTLGVNHPRWTPIIKLGARGIAGLIVVGNISMPIATFLTTAGIWKLIK